MADFLYASIQRQPEDAPSDQKRVSPCIVVFQVLAGQIPSVLYTSECPGNIRPAPHSQPGSKVDYRSGCVLLQHADGRSRGCRVAESLKERLDVDFKLYFCSIEATATDIMWHDGKRYQMAYWRPYAVLLFIFLIAGVIYFVITGEPVLLFAGLFVVLGLIVTWMVQALILRLYVWFLSRNPDE